MSARIVVSSLFVAVLALGRPAAAETAPKAPVLDMSAEGEVQIAIDGSVSDYRLNSQLPAQVAALVDRNVRLWHFEPIVIDGKAVIAKTAMHLSLRAEPNGEADHYRIKVTNVRFGGPRQHDQTHKPQYPGSAIAVRLGAKVVLALQLDDQGRVMQVEPLQTSLDMQANSEAEAETWRKRFERACVTAARSWHFDMSETLDGKPIGMVALVPIEFSLTNVPGSKPQDGQWKVYVPGPVHDVPWLKQGQLVANGDPSSLRGSDPQALDSRFHLKDDVVGKAL